ncbi:hypothetical protein [Croceimicrobium sp.]|uniref:hypothetical protein n=1 Tax=Croceimicrobium sp. TaxID=2828340 RepID=UPI003BAC2D08
MANTIKISKAKNLIFKKLSFLYLVFILFLFLSSPGKFLDHYENLVPAQEVVLEKLRTQLKELPEGDSKSQNLKAQTLSSLQKLEEIRAGYYDYRNTNHIAGEKLKENLFATNEIIQGSYGTRFQETLENFNQAYLEFGGSDLSAELLSPKDFADQEIQARDFFFKETPNAVIESVINHLETVILIHSIEALKGEKIELLKQEVNGADQLDLIQNFKKTLSKGEKLLFKVRLPDSIQDLKVLINGEDLAPFLVDSGFQHFEYLPQAPGNYVVDLYLDQDRYFHNFKVTKPGIKLNRQGSSYLSQVGETQVLQLNPQYLPVGDLSFISEHADLSYENGQLKITPYNPGAFDVYMRLNDEKVDSLSLYAKDVNTIDVALMDIAGKENGLNQLAYLEATNPFWQVVNFKLRIKSPEGRDQVFHNATRFLRSELKEAIRRAPEGSIMAFENIKVIGKNGHSYRNGRAILKMK